MRNPIAFLAAIALTGALATGCGHPLQRSLEQGGVKTLTMVPREAHIRWIDLEDERPASELGELEPVTRYVVPPFAFSSAGHLRADASLYSSDLPMELPALLRQTFDRSKLLSPGDAASGARLTIRLKHLYGISYRSTFFTLNFTKVTQFSQYGYAAAEVVLSDASHKIIGTRQVVGTFLPDGAMKEKSMTDALTLVAVNAASDLARNIVRAVEPMLAPYPAATQIPALTASIFFLVRPIPEGPFLEIAGVDFASGEVVSSVVVPRRMEPCSTPGEWVVDPYFGGKARLTPDEYDALVDRLRQKYDVRYVSDVRTAHFLGALAPPPPPAAKAKPRRSAAKK